MDLQCLQFYLAWTECFQGHDGWMQYIRWLRHSGTKRIHEFHFEKWLCHFHSAVLESTKRPLILVYDGYSSHFNEMIVSKAISLKIILVLLPSNATHLVQPLDIAVFRPFKMIMKRVLDQKMIKNALISISKSKSLLLPGLMESKPRKRTFFLALKSVGFGH